MLEGISSPSLITTPEVDGHRLDEPFPRTRGAPQGMLAPRVILEGCARCAQGTTGKRTSLAQFLKSLKKTSFEIFSELTHQEMRFRRITVIISVTRFRN